MITPPLSLSPAGGYPVIYVLDGNAAFGTVVETLRVQGRRPERTGVSPALVVAIGYPTEAAYDEERRTFDYLVFARGASSPKHGAGGTLRPDSGGGAAEFLRFLLEELKPAIAARYPVDPIRQTPLGHSFGGLLPCTRCSTDPSLFRTISP